MRAENPKHDRQQPSRVVNAVGEPWRVMVFVWQAINAALLPISLRNVPTLLDSFLAHLGRDGTRCRERRAAAFVRHLQEGTA